MIPAASSRTASRVLRITWPFVAIVALLLALAGVSLYVMSAVRAYVGGESLWSKSQKTAVQFLGRYARTHDESDFATAFALSQLSWEKDGCIPLGVFRDVERESYDKLVAGQLANAKGAGDLQALVASGDTWSIA